MRSLAGLSAVAILLVTISSSARSLTPPPAPPKTLQWLYGSAEASALSRLALESLARYAVDAQTRRLLGQSVEGAVLVSGATLEAPAWQNCTPAQPAAVIFDIDETLLLNTGWNRDAARRGDPDFDAKRWMLWEKTGADSVESVPGAVAAVNALRAANIAVFFVSNRDRNDDKGADIRESTRAALRAGGFADSLNDDNVLLSGDYDTPQSGTSKDLRRAHVAASHCVLAMGGDQFGDFSDRFNKVDGTKLSVTARRDLATSAAVTQKLGRGWFLLPNPAYGPGVAGGYGDLFKVKEWPTPQTRETK